MKEMVEKLKGSDGKYQNDFFVQYFSTCSYGEICTICRLFESTYNESVLEVIKNEMEKDAYDFIKIFQIELEKDKKIYFGLQSYLKIF